MFLRWTLAIALLLAPACALLEDSRLPSPCDPACGEELLCNNFTGECVESICGNSLVEGDEACDPGLDNSATTPNACRLDCTLVACGDGLVDPGETCDDGNTLNGDYCSADCVQEFGSCGDGHISPQAGEACDDDNTLDGDYCSTDCRKVTGACGDAVTQANEGCDDGNEKAGDYCSVDCQNKTGSCGDGVRQANEVCDDGNDDDAETCTSCACSTGYEEDDGICEDIDECVNDTPPCDAHATCTNVPGSFQCDCKSGYAGTGIACHTVTTSGFSQGGATGKCPDGSAPAQCLVNPCDNAQCHLHPNATCKPNYCGGCKAVFYDASRKAVRCGNSDAAGDSGNYDKPGKSEESRTTDADKKDEKTEESKNTDEYDKPKKPDDSKKPDEYDQREKPDGETCEGGQAFNRCGSACTSTCEDPAPACTRQCVPRCQCPADRPLWFKGKCIPKDSCPGKKPPTKDPDSTKPGKTDCSDCDCKEKESDKKASGTAPTLTKPGKSDCSDCKCKDDTKPGGCPDEFPLVKCKVNPCDNTKCYQHPNAMCKASYCGGCKAIFYDASYKVLKCGGPDEEKEKEKEKETCEGGQVFNRCGSACTNTCDDPAPTCTEQCVPRCQCPADRPLWYKGKCIPKDSCPGKTDCPDCECKKKESDKKPSTTDLAPTKSGKSDCPDCKCKDDTKPGGCPDGFPQVKCRVNPCDNTKCYQHPNAMCKASYCGGCKAIFYDASGKVLKCGDPDKEKEKETCEGGQVFNKCGSACTSTCDDPTPMCTLQCVPRCQCPADNPVWYKNRCIPAKICPDKKPILCKLGDREYKAGDTMPKTATMGACAVCKCGGDGHIKCDLSDCRQRCKGDENCPDNSWCRATLEDGKECTPYQREGATCGGFTAVWSVRKCAPGLECVAASDKIADAPGTCKAPLPNACKPGTVELADDGCNNCLCMESGDWRCNDTACANNCEDGDHKMASDGCNKCTCTTSTTGRSMWACTRMGCNGCTPGESKLSPDGCNTCMCVPKGAAPSETSLCRDCLSSGRTWQPEARACTDHCAIQDISCYKDVCPDEEGPERRWVCTDLPRCVEDKRVECKGDIHCDKGFCKRAHGACGDKGYCASMHEFCSDEGKPVCGCDGVTYTNACKADSMGVSLKARGECESLKCPSPSPFAGSCTQKTTWAINPLTRKCCRYPNPCVVPNSMKGAYENEKACLQPDGSASDGSPRPDKEDDKRDDKRDPKEGPKKDGDKDGKEDGKEDPKSREAPRSNKDG